MLMTTTVNFIRKNADGAFQFLTSAFPSYCIMTGEQLAALIVELERLKVEKVTARDIPVALFPDFRGMGKATRILIRKEYDGYRLIANVHSDVLCIMDQRQFERLIGELISLRDGRATPYKVNFPDFTYPITG